MKHIIPYSRFINESENSNDLDTIIELIKMGGINIDIAKTMLNYLEPDQVKELHARFPFPTEDGSILKYIISDSEGALDLIESFGYTETIVEQYSALIEQYEKFTGNSAFGFSNFVDDNLSPIKRLIRIVIEGEHLRIHHMRYHEVDKFLRFIPELINLQSLDITGCELDVLPENIGDLKNLISLLIVSNDLNSLPESFSQLTSLVQLSLAGNQFTEIPQPVLNLTTLEYLYFDENRLTDLPDSLLDSNKGLKRLSLSENKFEGHFPPVIFSLLNLKELYFEANQLSQIPTQIAGLENLQILHLQDNLITQIPDEIAGMKSLTTLNLSNHPQYKVETNKISREEVQRINELNPKLKILV